ncbi:MAG TPA: reverse transcriptase domain-containing protein [Bryobacteraceae bacterium]|jgi:hypothetical protein|nr:reverse transcriptase domain-containing protein [Bryobacteraceae bacterium]
MQLSTDRNFQLTEAVATVLAQIACHENQLPQGSPCSPVISNLVSHLMDIRLVALATEAGCTYSRYADDLTFSTNKKDFPTYIARPDDTEPHAWTPGERLLRVINGSGFEVNTRKTRMQYRANRQDVTGLIVNQKINVRREYRHNVRAMVHRLFSTGSFEVYGSVKKDGNVTIKKRQGTLNELNGKLGFIDTIDVYNKKHCPSGAGSALSRKEIHYRQFLIYKDFYTATQPVIICEGDTDNIYLDCAIRSLSAEFPALAETDANGKVKLKVRLYKYPRSSTARILGLHDGGSGNLATFMATYRRDTEISKRRDSKALS